MSSSALLRSVLKRNAFSLPASFKPVETEPFVPMTLGDGSILPQSALLEQLAALSTDAIDDADNNKPRRPLSHQYCPDPYSLTRPRPSSYPSVSKLARPAPEPDFTSIFFWSVHTGMYELPVADVTEADVELSISIGLAARERMGERSEVLKPVLVEEDEEEEEEGGQARVKEDGERTSMLKPLTFATRATAKGLDELAEGCRHAEGNKERGEELAAIEAKAEDVPLPSPSRSSQRHIPPPLAITVTSDSLSSSTHLTVSTSTSLPSFSIGKPELSPCSLLDTYFTLSPTIADSSPPFSSSPLSPSSEPLSPISPSGCSFIVDLYFDSLSPTPSPTVLASSSDLSCLPPSSPAPTASSFDLDAYFSPLPSPAASGYSFAVDPSMREDDVESGEEGSEDGESEGLVTPPSSPSKGVDVVLPGGDVEVAVPTTECAKEVVIPRPPRPSSPLLPPIDISSCPPSRRGSLESDGTASFSELDLPSALKAFPLLPTDYVPSLLLPSITIQAPTPPRPTVLDRFPSFSPPPSPPSRPKTPWQKPIKDLDRRLSDPAFMPPSLSFLTKTFLLSDVEEETIEQVVLL